MEWERPNDFDEWSESFVIKVYLNSLDGSVSLTQVLSSDVVSYDFTDLERGKTYLASVLYNNVFGDGDLGESEDGYITPTMKPDEPTGLSASDADEESVLTWSAPSFTGQTPVTFYRIYQDGSLIHTTADGDPLEHTVTGLTNGIQYQFTVIAGNDVSVSGSSEPATASPFGNMSIESVVVSNKTLTVTVRPNGKPLQSMLMLALDSDPNDLIDNGGFIKSLTQSDLPQTVTGTFQVVRIFNTFSSNINFWTVISHTASNSTFAQSS
jgi:hypothetical protein